MEETVEVKDVVILGKSFKRIVLKFMRVTEARLAAEGIRMMTGLAVDVIGEELIMDCDVSKYQEQARDLRDEILSVLTVMRQAYEASSRVFAVLLEKL